MIRWDVLHVWHLGVGRDTLAATLEVLREHGLFGADRSLPNRLSEAYRSFRSWCLTCKKYPVITNFTKENLHFSTAPSCTYKASDVILVISWLSDLLCEQDIEIERIGKRKFLPCTVVRALRQFVAPADRELVLARRVVCLMRMILTTWYRNSLIMRQEDQEKCYAAGLLVLRAWGHLSHMAASAGKTRWRLKKKIHALAHIIHAMADAMSHAAVNPASEACFMDEDMIGKICRVIKVCHPTTVGSRCLENYAAHLNSLLFPPAEAACAFGNVVKQGV